MRVAAVSSLFFNTKQKAMKNELKELKAITAKIRKLKKERVDKFGKKWHHKLYNINGHRWDKKTKLQYARKIESYIALNDLTIGQAVKNIGINRSVYYRLCKKSINVKNQKIIEAFFDKIEE